MRPKTKISKSVLILAGFALVIGLSTMISVRTMTEQFRKQQRAAQANLIGQLMAASPELTPAELARTLQTEPASATTKAGEAVLQQAGFLADEYDSAATRRFAEQVVALVLLALAALACSFGGYFIWHELRERRRLHRLIDYLQTLKERAYDLRLPENSEDELSLLTNEIYKLTVLLKEAAETNRKQRHDLENALADISHQLRTPLTSIQVMVDNVHDDPDMPVDVRQDFLQSITEQITSMSALVTTLLNLARFDSGTIKLHRRPIKLRELLQQACARVEVLAGLQDVKLIVDGDLDAQLTLDPRWQIEALSNIIKNCVEHSRHGATVKLRVTDAPLSVQISIEDTGEGIAAQELRHIFERFYKASNANPESVGIGLEFAKTVITAENGQIAVKSVEGQGTEFTITYFK